MTIHIQPKYYREFQCWGAECPLNCCNSWSITVDKKAFKQLRKHPNSQLQQLSKKHIKRHKEEDKNYGVLKLDQQGRCQFLDAKGWCQIHSLAGHEALPKTCQQYPRATFALSNRFEHSLNISCHAAAEKILLDPEAMQLHQLEGSHSVVQLQKRISDSAEVDQLTLLREFCFDVALTFDLNVDQRLFVIGIALKQVDKHLGDLPRIQQLLNTIVKMVADGSLIEQFEKLPSNDDLKWKLFEANDQLLAKYFAGEQPENLDQAQQFFASLQQPFHQQMKLIAAQSNDDSSQHQHYRELLEQAESNYLNAYFDEHFQIETNYLLYSFYHSHLESSNNSSPFDFFRTLLVDRMMIRNYLAGIAVANDGITHQDTLSVFAAYSRKRQHSPSYINNINRILEPVEQQFPNALFTLLR